MAPVAPGEEGAVCRSGRNGRWLQTPPKTLCAAPAPRPPFLAHTLQVRQYLPSRQGWAGGFQRGSSSQGAEQQLGIQRGLATAEHVLHHRQPAACQWGPDPAQLSPSAPAPLAPLLPMSWAGASPQAPTGKPEPHSSGRGLGADGPSQE